MFDTIPSMTPEERIRQLCAAIAAESDPEQLRSLFRQLEFALTEYSLDVQNRAVFLANTSGIPADG